MDDSFSEIMMPDFFTEFLVPNSGVKTSQDLTVNSTTVAGSLSVASQTGSHPVPTTATNHPPVASIPQKQINVRVTVDSAKVPVSRQDVVATPRAVASTAKSPSEATWSSVIKGRGKHRLSSQIDTSETNDRETRRQPKKRSRYSGLSEEDAEMKRLKENKQEKERQAMISANFEDLRREISYTNTTRHDSKAKTLRNATDFLRSLKLNAKTMMGFLQNLMFIINILIQYIIQEQRNSKKSPDDIIISMTPYVTLASISKTLATISEFCDVSFNDPCPQKQLNSFEPKHPNTPNGYSTHQMPVSTSGPHLQMPKPLSGLHFQTPVSTSGSYNQYPVDVNTPGLSPITPESDSSNSSCGITQNVQSIFETNIQLMSKPVEKGMEYPVLTLSSNQPTTDIYYQLHCNKTGRHFDLKKPTRRILPKPNPQRLIFSQSPEGLTSNLTPLNNVREHFPTNSKWYQNGHKHFVNHQPSQNLPYGSNLNVQNSNVTDMDSNAGPDNMTILIPLANIVPQNAATVQCSPVHCAPVHCAKVQSDPVQCNPVQCAPIQPALVQCVPVHCAPVQCAPVQCAPVQPAPVQCVSVSRIAHHSGSFSNKTNPDIKHSRKEEPVYSPVSPYQEFDDDNTLILPARIKLLSPFSQ